MQTLIVSILVFGLIIAVHEFGHFAAAKLSGIYVEEFSIGMGPKVFSHQGQETLYSLRLLPMGGFVKMEGEYYEDDDEDAPPIESPRSFNNQPVLNRIFVVIAGVIMNFLLALFLFAFIAFSTGIPTGSTHIADVVAGSPAEMAGFLPGDIILEANGKKINDRNDLDTVIKTNPNKEIEFKVERDSQLVSLYPVLGEGEEKLGYLGIAGDTFLLEKPGFFLALKYAFKETTRLMVFIIASFKFLFSGHIGLDSFSGPVGIIQVIDETAKIGILPLLYLTGFMSANIGFINLLPIPGLDGSKIIFLAYEGLKGSPIDRKKEGFLTMLGFAFLMGLILLITYNDISRFFGG